MARIPPKKYDKGGNVYEVLGDENGGSHVYLERRVVEGTRFIEGEPRRVDDRATRSIGKKAIQSKSGDIETYMTPSNQL